MPAKIIDGKAIADAVCKETAAEAAELLRKHGVTPGLAVVLVGENPASQVYVGMKVKKCQELGLYSEKIVLPKDCSEEALLAEIAELNANPKIHGILVQSPPPPQIDEAKVVEAILPSKDVDCFHPENVGRMLMGDDKGFLPCTPWGVMVLLEKSGVSPAGKRVVVIGRSNIVGKPMAALLMQKGSNADATVTICHSKTKDMASVCREADIIIAAIGKPEFVKADMVKEGAVVIDVGINRIADPCSPKGSRIVGDVAFKEVSEKASLITPVPGGVGPMTIAMLMKNAVKACRMSLKRQ